MKSPLVFIISGTLTLAVLTSCCDEPYWARRKARVAEESARLRAAPIHFLATSQEIWEPAHWRYLNALTRLFDLTKRHWDTMMRRSRNGPEVQHHLRDLRRIRADIEIACTRLELLTPEGQGRWAAWQTSRWSGYPLPSDFAGTTDPDIFAAPDESPDSPQKRAEANFWAYRETLQGPLRREIEERALRENSLRSDSRQARLAELYGETEKLHAKWSAQNWSGYIFKEIPVIAPRGIIPRPSSVPGPATLP